MNKILRYLYTQYLRETQKERFYNWPKLNLCCTRFQCNCALSLFLRLLCTSKIIFFSWIIYTYSFLHFNINNYVSTTLQFKCNKKKIIFLFLVIFTSKSKIIYFFLSDYWYNNLFAVFSQTITSIDLLYHKPPSRYM